MRKKITPLKSIRQKCLECAGRPKEVRLCSAIECPLYPYRFGHNPARIGISPGFVKKSLVDSAKTTKKEALNGHI